MKDLKLDNTNDLSFENADIAMTSDSDQLRQRLHTRLKTFLGEWFLDTTIGVPFFQEIFVKIPNLRQVDSVLQEQILDDDEILSLDAYSSSYVNATRKFSCTFTVSTIYGPVSGEF